MLLLSAQRSNLLYSAPGLIHRGLLLLLTVSMLTGTLAAQSEQDAKRMAGQELMREGHRLLDDRTSSSLEAALRKNMEALSIFDSIGYLSGKVAALQNIGVIYGFLGDGQKKLDYLTQALSLARAAKDSEGEAATLRSLGEHYTHSPDGNQKALQYLKQSLLLFMADKKFDEEVGVLHRIGRIYESSGGQQEAVEYFTQLLPLFQAAQDAVGEAAANNNLGLVYQWFGDYQKAFDNYTRALSLFHASGHYAGKAGALNNLGLLYTSLGDYEQASGYFMDVLSLCRLANDRACESMGLINMGRVHMASGKFQDALDNFMGGLKIQRVFMNPFGMGRASGNISSAYQALRDDKKSLDYAMEALKFAREAKDIENEAAILHAIGTHYHFSARDHQKALEYYNQSISLLQQLGDFRGVASVLHIIASIERDRGNLREAQNMAEVLINLVEGSRAKMFSQSLRTSYFEANQYSYESYIELLMRMHKQQPSAGYDQKAFQANERRRARSLIEILAEAGADISQGVDSKLIERERSLRQQLNAKALPPQLLGTPPAVVHAESRDSEMAGLRTELQQVEAQIKQASPGYAALAHPQSLTLHDIQAQVLDGNTLLLEYSLGEDRSYLWAITSTNITSYELPKRTEIETAARQLYNLISPPRDQQASGKPRSREDNLTRRRPAINQKAAQLSRMLLLPVAKLLGDKRLLIVSDGALQYIPFAMLPKPADDTAPTAIKPLIVAHEIVNLPSASTLAVLRRETDARPPAPKTLAVLADPVFELNDERLKGVRGRIDMGKESPVACSDKARGSGLIVTTAARQSDIADGDFCIERLPHTRREADAIVKFVPPGQYKQAFGFTANRAMVTSPELGQYRYLHFATHGFINDRLPGELSGIVLSLFDGQGKPQDGFLRAHEIYNLKLAADVVVLSACTTGLGKESQGEGMIGLTRGFMYAGARRVVTSLWDVDDAATAELMARFYRGMLMEKLRPAQALRAAQVSMLKERHFNSPVYWAAFTLQGEWR